MSTSPTKALGPSIEFDEEALTRGDVYAEALLRAADENGQVDAVAGELADLVAYMNRDADFNAFMIAATVDDEPRRASLEKLFRGRMNDLLLNLLQVLNNRGRMGLLRAIARCVELRLEARRDQQEVTVQTAMPLTTRLREQIRRAVSAYIGKEALLIEEVSSELIGGMILQIGDIRVDASVATQLLTMRRRLANRATAEVHQSQRYVVEG